MSISNLYLSLYRFIYLTIYLSIYLSICSASHPPISQRMHICVYTYRRAYRHTYMLRYHKSQTLFKSSKLLIFEP